MDYVLYKKVGRGPIMPIFSCDPNTPNLDILIATHKQNHVQLALAGGSPMPEFSEQSPDTIV